MIIDNHKNFCDRLSIDYQYQSINGYRLSSIVIDCHRLSISSIVQVLYTAMLMLQHSSTKSITLDNIQTNSFNELITKSVCEVKRRFTSFLLIHLRSYINDKMSNESSGQFFFSVRKFLYFGLL